MEDKTNGNRIRTLLIISVLLNILFASLTVYFLFENSQMQGRIMDFSTSYNQLVLSVKDLEQRLNMTTTQLDYYKKLVEYNSSLGISDNFETGLVGSATIPIVAVREVQHLFQTEYEGVVMYANVELREGSGRILIGMKTKIGVDIQTSLETASKVAERLTNISLSRLDVLLTLEADQDVEIVDGQSAGATLTTALIAALTDKKIREGTFITGTINGDASIGAVSGIPYKALAAAKNGSRIFLIPKGQSNVVVYEPETRQIFPGRTIIVYERKVIGLEEYLKGNGFSVDVVEVETMKDVLPIFLG